MPSLVCGVSEDIDISTPLAKEIVKHLHSAVSNHRKKIHGKKKKDFNFKHEISKHGKGNSQISIHKWMQDQKAYGSKALCYMFYNHDKYPNIIHMKNQYVWWGGDIERKNNSICKVDIANPDSFNRLAEELINLLDWRG